MKVEIDITSVYVFRQKGKYIRGCFYLLDMVENDVESFVCLADLSKKLYVNTFN